jgi:hypothetical protein
MLADLLSTPDDPLLTIIRMVLGVIMFAHGAKGAFPLDSMFYQRLGNLGGPAIDRLVPSRDY